MIDRDLFRTVDAYSDTALDSSYAAADLCLRVLQARRTNWYLPSAELYYLEGLAVPAPPSERQSLYNDCLFANAWADRLEALLVEYGSRDCCRSRHGSAAPPQPSPSRGKEQRQLPEENKDQGGASALIAIREVACEKPKQPLSEPYLGCWLDSPKCGEQFDEYSFMVDGWVLGRNSPGDQVAFVSGGEVICRVPVNIRRQDVAKAFPGVAGADHAGFRTMLSCLQLPHEFHVLVIAILQDGSRFPVGQIHGRRQPLKMDREVRYQPLLLTTLGRSGSSWLTWLLAQHPQLVVYEPFKFEARVLSYWLDILKVLSQPQSYRLTIQGDLTGPYWWIGDQAKTPFARALDDPSSVQKWMARDHIEDLAAFCQNRIDSTYREIARKHGRTNPHYLVEKVGTNQILNPLIWELYPQARDVYLVRDFRDLFCSILAYNKKMGYNSFGREFVTSDLEFVHHLGNHAATLLFCWKKRARDSYLLRYEDLIQSPQETLKNLMEHLHLDSSPATIEQMLQQATIARADVQKGHQTSGDPKSSIGRWRNDLPESLRDECNKVFAPLLAEFGYPSE